MRMTRTCSQCDAEATAALLQEPLCQDHAEERLAELEAEASTLEETVQDLKEKYDSLCNKYDVQSYGEIEHQLNVEGREDIDDSDVQAVNEAESEYAAKREELRGVEHKIDNLKRDL